MARNGKDKEKAEIEAMRFFVPPLRGFVDFRQAGVDAARRAPAARILRTGGAHPSGGVPPTLDFSFSKKLEGK